MRSLYRMNSRFVASVGVFALVLLAVSIWVLSRGPGSMPGPAVEKESGKLAPGRVDPHPKPIAVREAGSSASRPGETRADSRVEPSPSRGSTPETYPPVNNLGALSVAFREYRKRQQRGESVIEAELRRDPEMSQINQLKIVQAGGPVRLIATAQAVQDPVLSPMIAELL